MPNVQTDPLAPAVVVLHYHYGTPEVMANLIEAGRLAAEHGAWVILPEADDEWNENPDKSDGTDDVGFLSQLITKIGRAHVLTPVTNAHLVCRFLLYQKKNTNIIKLT